MLVVLFFSVRYLWFVFPNGGVTGCCCFFFATLDAPHTPTPSRSLERHMSAVLEVFLHYYVLSKYLTKSLSLLDSVPLSAVQCKLVVSIRRNVVGDLTLCPLATTSLSTRDCLVWGATLYVLPLSKVTLFQAASQTKRPPAPIDTLMVVHRMVDSCRTYACTRLSGIHKRELRLHPCRHSGHAYAP